MMNSLSAAKRLFTAETQRRREINSLDALAELSPRLCVSAVKGFENPATLIG
jgi:hypothetical protein